MKTYYFVSYAYQLDKGYTFGQKLVDVHPLSWILSMNYTSMFGDKYTLISWQKLTNEEYKEYRDFL